MRSLFFSQYHSQQVYAYVTWQRLLREIVVLAVQTYFNASISIFLWLPEHTCNHDNEFVLLLLPPSHYSLAYNMLIYHVSGITGVKLLRHQTSFSTKFWNSVSCVLPPLSHEQQFRRVISFLHLFLNDKVLELECFHQGAVFFAEWIEEFWSL